jgi:hypothetical protein
MFVSNKKISMRYIFLSLAFLANSFMVAQTAETLSIGDAAPATDVKMVAPKPVQLIPFVEVIMVFVVLPTATHKDPLYATPNPPVENTAPRETQLIPSKEVATELVPAPTATHIPLLEPSLPYSILLVRVVIADNDGIQLTPSNEYPSVFVP